MYVLVLQNLVLYINPLNAQGPLCFMTIYIHTYDFIYIVYLYIIYDDQNVRVVQLEEARTVNHAVDGSSPSCVKLTKRLPQPFNSNQLGLSGWSHVPQYYCGHI